MVRCYGRVLGEFSFPNSRDLLKGRQSGHNRRYEGESGSKGAEMKNFKASLAIGACLLFCSAGLVLGAQSAPGTQGTQHQPGTTAGFNCGTMTAPVEPGQASSSPGSPFNETTPGHAGTVYAGSTGTASLANAASPAAVSQYDVACHQLTIK